MLDLSVCLVSLNCERVIEACLDSFPTCSVGLNIEIIIVDNGSRDRTVSIIQNRYPWVRLICNRDNVGFVKGTNQGLALSSGRTVLWLNCDTVLPASSLTRLVEFLDQRPVVGIVGPKVLNIDGSFQPQCKRGMPTPLASIAYFTGLDKFWKRHRELGQYLLRYLPEDESARVDAVSGCCLMAKRGVMDQIGMLDANIFAYGEDLDWCVRATKAGWQVWYAPVASIIHLKGQGGAHSVPYKKIRGMHDGMWIFYRKHLQANYGLATSLLIYCGIRVSFLLAVARAALFR